ncbi:ABC transporter permease [Prosthecomicrobium hirschii]|uniref:ABC transporter permease n=1 Tax=Prosthecodimorpha hirschii TaxID=665126 RepID=UPI0009FA78C7|nr:ABC transporter permease [Prosthecomicrobium hirschii]
MSAPAPSPDLARARGRADGIPAALVGLVAVTAGCLWALGAVHRPDLAGQAPAWFWGTIVALWLAAWWVTDRLAKAVPPTPGARRVLDLMVPLLFGAFLIFLWEIVTVGAGVPMVLMPPPSAIGARLAQSLPTLAEDFGQTVLRAVIPGWALGSGLGIAIALLCDRVPFLRRGLMPIGNFVSALPMIGIAPIMVMWFGFDWQSKVAVVVVMTFFPALVNTVAGLSASGALERDLMRSYAADWATTLLKLRLPSAMPFVFNALKINSTLALIGAIVAEFFGTPILGMGFRISTEVGRMSLDMVWAEIAVAAVTGSVFYGLLALAERRVTFWHPSYRRR